MLYQLQKMKSVTNTVFAWVWWQELHQIFAKQIVDSIDVHTLRQLGIPTAGDNKFYEDVAYQLIKQTINDSMRHNNFVFLKFSIDRSIKRLWHLCKLIHDEIAYQRSQPVLNPRKYRARIAHARGCCAIAQENLCARATQLRVIVSLIIILSDIPGW